MASQNASYLLHNNSTLENLKKLVPSFLSHVPSLECESCQISKKHHAYFLSKSENKLSNSFFFFHSNVVGRDRVSSHLGFHYFVMFVDDYSKFAFAFLNEWPIIDLLNFQSFCPKIKPKLILLCTFWEVITTMNIYLSSWILRNNIRFCIDPLVLIHQ